MPDEQTSQDLSTVAVTVHGEQARLWSLVLDAVAIPHRLERHGVEWHCLTAQAAVDAARCQIGRFEIENRNWPPPPPEVDRAWDHRQPPTLLVMGALLVFYTVTGPWQGESRWFTGGAIDGVSILRDGQWWRLLTALTLHAGPVHLLGNVCFGAVLVHYVCKRLGVGLGWLLVLCAGMFGNLINVIARSGEHHAVGFSTAVFGAVGILCGLELQVRSWRGLLLPLGGGAALLAMLGAGGERTDLGAHFWGLIVGCLLGWLVVRLPDGCRRSADSLPVQTILFVACAGALWGCWRLAL